MVASTLIVVASLPLYSFLFHRYGFVGLAMASGLGILLHTVVIAWLLHWRNLVPLQGLPWGEVSRVLITALVAGAICYAVSLGVSAGSWRQDLLALSAIGLAWLAAVVAGLWITRSRLWQDLRRGKKQPAMAEPPAIIERTEGGVQP